MRDEVSTLAKVTPAIGGAGLAGITLNEWVMLATLVYVLAQLGLLIPKYWAMFRPKTGDQGGDCK